ncbi:MAG TPA: GGDEF domain-containing protein [Polyangiaceae bacterium]|nr:GGDEF domain-containing protein [Polyangiaceae bacterium]
MSTSKPTSSRRRSNPKSAASNRTQPKSTRALEIVRAGVREDVTIEELVTLASGDPAFALKMLEAVNSAAFGLRNKVNDLTRAGAMLGVRGLRNLALGMATIDMTPLGPEGDLLLGCCLRRAMAARAIAERADASVSPDDAFTVGLFLEFGLLAHAAEDVAVAVEAARMPAEVRPIQERAAGLSPHPERGARVAASWRLDESVQRAIASHHQERCPEQDLAKVAWAAERLAGIYEGGEPKRTAERCHAALARLGIVGEPAQELIEQLPGQVRETAAAFKRQVEQPDHDALMEDVNQQLLALNQSLYASLRRVEQLLADKARLAADLATANEELQRLATQDPLTGLSNRRAFQLAMGRDLARASRSRKPISVVIMDIDHFKRVNDTYGHGGGDAVLKAVSAVLSASVRQGDVVARWGGEEFALILPETPSKGARILADRLRAALAETVVNYEGTEIRVSASFGVASAEVIVPDMADKLLSAADEALYRAKEAGRNRVMLAA